MASEWAVEACVRDQTWHPIRQVGYWVRRLRGAPAAPTLLAVRVVPAIAAATPLSLRSEQGWTLTLPGDVPASWLAELMRAL